MQDHNVIHRPVDIGEPGRKYGKAGNTSQVYMKESYCQHTQ